MSYRKLITRNELPNFLNNIRRLPDGSVSINGLIVKPNGLIVGIPFTLVLESDLVQNVGSALSPLHTITIPAGSLNSDDDFLEVYHSGGFASNDSDKRVQISIDGNVVENTGLIDLDQFAWNSFTNYKRLSATSLLVSSVLIFGFLQSTSGGALSTTGLRLINRADIFTVANLNNNDIDIEVEAQGSNSGDVTQNISRVYLTQMS